MSPNSFSIRWIQTSFLMFAFIIPLCYIFIILLLWITPLYPKEQRRLFIVAEIIRAWSSMEVFVLAVITALVALQQFTQSIIGNRCDFINEVLKRFIPWVFNGGPEICFDIRATLLSGCWLMFISVVLYIIVGQIVMSLCHKVIQEQHKFYPVKKTKGILNEYKDVLNGYLILFLKKCHIITFSEKVHQKPIIIDAAFSEKNSLHK